MGDGRYRSSRCFHSPWSKLLPKIDTIFWRKSNIKSDLFSPPISNQNLPPKMFYILAVKIMLTPHQLNTFCLHKVLQLEAILYSYRTFVRPLLEYSSILFPLAYSRQHYLWPNKATHWWSKTFYNWTSLRSLQSSEIFFILLCSAVDEFLWKSDHPKSSKFVPKSDLFLPKIGPNSDLELVYTFKADQIWTSGWFTHLKRVGKRAAMRDLRQKPN